MSADRQVCRAMLVISSRNASCLAERGMSARAGRSVFAFLVQCGSALGSAFPVFASAPRVADGSA